MALMLSQRDLVATFKKETFLNANILRIMYPMSPELSRQIFKEDALDKPSQGFFINLSYYLICIVDPKGASVITWPLFDSKSERTYRTEFANFISKYYDNGSISPVMSSYFVNPGCYKITRLMFQLSMLAVKVSLQNNVKREESKNLFSQVTEKYKTDNTTTFQNFIDKITKTLNMKISQHANKKNKMERAAEMLKERIIKNINMQKKAQLFLNKVIDDFLLNNKLTEEISTEIELLKDIHADPSILDHWLNLIDQDIASIEDKWNKNTTRLIEISRKCQKSTEEVILRHTGQIDKKFYTVEFDPNSNHIDIDKLALQVPSQQKFILKNIIKNNELVFPNMIKGFVVAICYIFKNLRVGEDIFPFNEILVDGQEKYTAICSTLKKNVNHMSTELIKLESTPEKFTKSFEKEDLLFTIPAPPSLSFSEDINKPQIIFNNFTPLNVNRRQFNLKKKNSLPILTKSSIKSLVVPYLHVPKEEFLKTINHHTSSYDRFYFDQTAYSLHHNMKIDESVTSTSSGFTKDQLNRLLSTKKSSIKKKSTPHGHGHMKRGSLFNYSNSNPLFRSHSSPNLYENRERLLSAKIDLRPLPAMPEHCNDFLDLSGIVALENSKNTPSKEEEIEAPSVDVDNKQVTENLEEKPSAEVEKQETFESIEHNVTPKLQNHPIRKSNSIEKIINRFKKVRANVCESRLEFDTIKEEKEKLKTNMDTVLQSKQLLPDLLEQSCNVNIVSEFSDWMLCDSSDGRKKPRESLGTALGIDNLFLDKLEIID